MAKEIIIYSEPTTEEERRKTHIINKRFGLCPHCGKESPVAPEEIGRGWPKGDTSPKQSKEELQKVGL